MLDNASFLSRRSFLRPLRGVVGWNSSVLPFAKRLKAFNFISSPWFSSGHPHFTIWMEEDDANKRRTFILWKTPSRILHLDICKSTDPTLLTWTTLTVNCSFENTSWLEGYLHFLCCAILSNLLWLLKHFDNNSSLCPDDAILLCLWTAPLPMAHSGLLPDFVSRIPATVSIFTSSLSALNKVSTILTNTP